MVLAADRKAEDPVAKAAGVACKALGQVGGEAMIMRVLRALEHSARVGERVICGPSSETVAVNPELNAKVTSGEIRWLEHAATPSTSTYAALNTLPTEQAVLVTTADHALLSSEMVNYFLDSARQEDWDLAFALAPHELVDSAHPGVRRTILKFRDGGYCSCNLFAFMTARSRQAADYWRQVERQRKRPWRIARTLGWTTVLRYVLGRLSLQDVLELASKRLGIRVGAVVMPFAEAAIDVDTVDDWAYVNALIQSGAAASTPQMESTAGGGSS